MRNHVSAPAAWAATAALLGVAGPPLWPQPSSTPRVRLEAPSTVQRFGVAEFVVRIANPPFGNPFTDADLTGVFTSGSTVVRVSGFADSQDGSVFRLRFCPEIADATYRYRLRLTGASLDQEFTGNLRCTRSRSPGPVVVAPRQPRHFTHAGSGKPFYHLGYTAYHLFDTSNADGQVDETIDYCARHGFNKIRFLLAGYPRDTDRRTSGDAEHGVPEGWNAPNYGSRPGQVNALPAWLGEPHSFDFRRFHVPYWRRVERGIRRMRDKGIVATCIVTIEKQGLPDEYGDFTDAEKRLYRYAVARLAAFDNVWWDLGNEHNEYRSADWANRMGALVKESDPYDRLVSAHGYADFQYASAPWADFIITQQYGDERAVHDWALKYASSRKPYVNEEYGYEGDGDKPGHGQNGDWVRRCHWAIAMAGGYATYGDWSGGISYFYMGEPGPGKAAVQLKHLRSFFEALPFGDLKPADDLVSRGFCLASPPDAYVAYFPRGGECSLDLTGASGRLAAMWLDPRTGGRRKGPALRATRNRFAAPTGGDWALVVTSRSGAPRVN